MPIIYKNEQIGTRKVNFLVEEYISVELKAIIKLENVHFAQAINYLEAYNLEIGLLLNFGSESLEMKRLLNSKYKSLWIAIYLILRLIRRMYFSVKSKNQLNQSLDNKNRIKPKTNK